MRLSLGRGGPSGPVHPAGWCPGRVSPAQSAGPVALRWCLCPALTRPVRCLSFHLVARVHRRAEAPCWQRRGAGRVLGEPGRARAAGRVCAGLGRLDWAPGEVKPLSRVRLFATPWTLAD